MRSDRARRLAETWYGIHMTDAEHPCRNAGSNQDHKISLSELLCVIQFYNLNGLHCASGTEDSYAPGLSPDKGLLPLAPGVDLSPDKGLSPLVRTWEGEALLSRQTKHTRNTFPRSSYATTLSFPRRRESRPSLSFSCSHSSRAVRHSCRFRYSHEGGNPEEKYNESWIPACAGMTVCCENQEEKYSESWIPACAGMTALYGTKADCGLHSSDYNPPDWHISMSELLRAIQLFRSPGYHPCIDGEDGFRAG